MWGVFSQGMCLHEVHVHKTFAERRAREYTDAIGAAVGYKVAKITPAK